MTKYAVTYKDLEPVTKARSLLSNCVSMLEDCDPTAGYASLDEEYKIASRHSFPLDAIAKLDECVNTVYATVTTVRNGYHRTVAQAEPVTSDDRARVLEALAKRVTDCKTFGELAGLELVAKRGY